MQIILEIEFIRIEKYTLIFIHVKTRTTERLIEILKILLLWCQGRIVGKQYRVYIVWYSKVVKSQLFLLKYHALQQSAVHSARPVLSLTLRQPVAMSLRLIIIIYLNR